MKKYTFKNGYVLTSNLEAKELVNRMNRLDTLRVMVEENDCDEAKSICRKAMNAYNKTNGFTGIIRLTAFEKDWLSYMLEDELLSEKEKEIVRFYCK